jgi:1-deoxy-D-xylulose-5-phosphate reductoisomerase
VTLLTLLGSTGSIGTSTLDVVRRWPDRFGIFALVAGRNTELLARQIAEFRPQVAVVADDSALNDLRSRLGSYVPELACGAQARVDAARAPEAGFVMSAIVGVEGMEATYEAVRLGKRVGLANKETLVASGKLVIAAMRASGTELLPVDSEHNGAHQCFRAGCRNEVAKLILTASGGPFRKTPAEALAKVTPEQALNHPTWKMGPRITIDSATLMNKGFEVIEACRLFGLPPSRVKVLVHPQSTIHSMVEFVDGSILAQFSVTDMRLPILYALTFPERIASDMRFPVMNLRHLEFSPPDMEKFPCLRLAYMAAEAGGSKPVALNAADEVSVAAFLDGSIRFDQISQVIEAVISETDAGQLESIGQVLEADARGRRAAREKVAELAGSRPPRPTPAIVRGE